MKHRTWSTRSGSFWLFFSGNWFNQPNYAVGLARCAGPAGPCTDGRAPFLASNDRGQGPGEESVFEDGPGHWWLVFSAWFDGYLGRDYRPVALARVGFRRTGPYIAAS